MMYYASLVRERSLARDKAKLRYGRAGCELNVVELFGLEDAKVYL